MVGNSTEQLFVEIYFRNSCTVYQTRIITIVNIGIFELWK